MSKMMTKEKKMKEEKEKKQYICTHDEKEKKTNELQFEIMFARLIHSLSILIPSERLFRLPAFVIDIIIMSL